ncbi:MAG: UPF0158 family protein [Sphaerochaetaceae bacterium]|nr:UPF0158 family protein [Sphaerochaetaceae bacterium]MDC7250125.1 UPF0158 family protein [Sphaerochaetaceae bacterium]
MEKDTYKLPPLTSYLLKSIIFSMENQDTRGYLDLISGEVVEVSNTNDSIVVKESENSSKLVSIKIAQDKDRFLELPTWGSIEGFKIREQFIKDVKNPIYKEKLDHIFHTGRGVFRKFKQVLKENPIIERQWREFKTNYMRAIVINWYEECEGYIDLIGLEEEIEELPNDLLISDFIFSTNVNQEDLNSINQIKANLISDLDFIEKILIERRQNLLKNPRYVVAYNLENEIVGYIEWEDIGKKCVEVTSYGVVEMYRGLGVFTLMFDKLMRQTNRERFDKLIVFSTKIMNCLRRNVEKSDFSCNFSYSMIDIILWNQDMDSTELMDV